MPSSKNYVRDYTQERKAESNSRKDERATRNRARYALMKEGKVKVGDGKDVGHKRALSKGGGNNLSNLMVQAPAANRSFSRTKSGSMKSETSKKEASTKKKTKA